MTLAADAIDEEVPGMEALRSRFAARGVAAKPGGRLRKSQSTAAVALAASNFAYEKTAVESVHGGLVVSLDADCRAYRAEIASLTKRCAQLEEHAKPASELHQQLQAMGEELRLMRSQAADASRMRETQQSTIRDLRQQLAESREQRQQQQGDTSGLAALEAALADTRAERNALSERMSSMTDASEAEATAARAAAQGLEAAERKHAESMGRLEARLAESEAKRARLVEVEATLRADLAAAREAMAENAGKALEAAEGLKSRLERATEEAAAAKGESGALAQRLAAAAEKADEKGRRHSEQAASLKAENGRLNEVLKSLRAKLDARASTPDEGKPREQDATRAAAAAKRLERRVSQLESSNAELQAEVLRWRTAAEEARGEAEAARARADLARAEPSAERPAVLGPVDDPRGTAFGKHMKTVQAQQTEIAQLKEQVDHLSFLLASANAPQMSHAATSPLKVPRSTSRPEPGLRNNAAGVHLPASTMTSRSGDATVS